MVQNILSQPLKYLLFNLFSSIEQKAGWLLGKGYIEISNTREVEFVDTLLAQIPAVAVDVGGNKGNYTEELIKRYAGLEVHIFEPSEQNVAHLEKRYCSENRIKIHPVALSNKRGQAVLYSNSPGSVLGSLKKRQLKHTDIEFKHEETVKVECFEDYWSNTLNGKIIDIVKIDVVGYELAVLEGFGKAINATRLVQFETGGTNIDTRIFFKDFWNYFKDIDFVIYRMTPIGLKKIKVYNEQEESFLFANYIAVNNRL